MFVVAACSSAVLTAEEGEICSKRKFNNLKFPCELIPGSPYNCTTTRLRLTEHWQWSRRVFTALDAFTVLCCALLNRKVINEKEEEEYT